MPQIVEYIDAIARERGRDVLWVTFFNPRKPVTLLEREELDRNAQRRRKQFIQFIEDQSIPWRECYELESAGMIMRPYLGSIYLDIAQDLNDPRYTALVDYLETPTGEQKRPGVYFWVLTLDTAIKNAANVAMID